MEIAKIFWSGRSQAVRLPKEFRFAADKVRVRRHGSAVILEPIASDWNWLDVIAGRSTTILPRPRAKSLPSNCGPISIAFSSNAVPARHQRRHRATRTIAIRALRSAPARTNPPTSASPQSSPTSSTSARSRAVRTQENVALLDELQFEVVEFDKEDARQAGEVRATLAALGTPIGPYDILIAGQAKSRDLILVSRNMSEFGRVPGLRVENWEI